VTKSCNHTRSIHRSISNSSSTKNFPWLSSTDNWTDLPFPYYIIQSRHGLRNTENTSYVSECVYWPAVQHWAWSRHMENTSSVVPYNHPARTTTENTASRLLCDVRENVFSVRCLATVRANTTEHTAPLLLACVCCGRCLAVGLCVTICSYVCAVFRNNPLRIGKSKCHISRLKCIILWKRGLWRTLLMKMQWTIFGPKREVVTGEWGKLPKGELDNLLISISIAGWLYQSEWDIRRPCGKQ
jgi:hypothetical protein